MKMGESAEDKNHNSLSLFNYFHKMWFSCHVLVYK